jgi:hypothetical protein
MASDYLEVPFKARKLTAIPAGLRSSVSLKSWVPLITYAVEQARNIRFYGSRFVNMHLTRLLSTHARLASSMRKVFDACSLPSATGVQGLWMRTSQTAS